MLIDAEGISAVHIRRAFMKPRAIRYELEWAVTLPEALIRLAENNFSAVIIDLLLLERGGADSRAKLATFGLDLPILVLSDADSEESATTTLTEFGQDYLLRSHLDGFVLSLALDSAIGRRAVEEALYVERERAIVTLNSIGDAVLSVDTMGRVSYLNAMAAKMTGWGLKEGIGYPLADVFKIIDGVTRKVADNPLDLAMLENRTVGLTVNCIMIRRDGLEFAIEDSAAPIHDHAGRTIGAVIVFHDVSVARAMSAKMTYAAQHDLVTDLPNRLLLKDRIAQAILSAHRRRIKVGLLFVDLDYFKNINDTLGHAAGDQLLQTVAKRLVDGVRHSDTVSRQGGDEFVVLLSEISSHKDAELAAMKLLALIREPQMIGSQELQVGCSIGISVYPRDGADADTLLMNADTAMYEAKKKGRNNVQYFDPSMRRKIIERQTIEQRLRTALDRQEFVLYFQPKVDLKTGAIEGVEALVRWLENGRVRRSPAEFISVAEESGLIVPIGRWVLRNACLQARAWQLEGMRPLQMAVNVSAVQFRDLDFVESVQTILNETGIEANLLELELTESVLMSDVESTIGILSELKAMGVHLAIDDFGTGFSSLSYLRLFPIDVLKVDMSFVRRMMESPRDTEIIRCVINLAKGLKQRVVAEGIETLEQKEHLLSLECTHGQGYLFSRPVTALDFAELMWEDQVVIS